MIYDLIIIGVGPAGYTAGIYAQRYKINNLIIGAFPGGLASQAHKIGNFPSEKEISGEELMTKIREHFQSLGGMVIFDEVVEIKKKKKNKTLFFQISTKNNKKFRAKTLLLAIGTKRRKLNLPGEEKYIGKGVSYCTACDGFFYKNKKVAVVGGGDSAILASLRLAEIAKKVYQICSKDKLKGEKTRIEEIKKNRKIEILYNNKIIDLFGEKKLEGILLSQPFKNRKKLKIDGLFIEIGLVPDRVLIRQINLKTNRQGYIIVNQNQATSLRGVWAAGDITTSSAGFRQIITACSEGAIAIQSIQSFLTKS